VPAQGSVFRAQTGPELAKQGGSFLLDKVIKKLKTTFNPVSESLAGFAGLNPVRSAAGAVPEPI
jgi:hypothetical protein